MEFKTSDVYNSEQMTENCAIQMVDKAISELIVVGLMTYPAYLLLKRLGDTHGTKSR